MRNSLSSFSILNENEERIPLAGTPVKRDVGLAEVFMFAIGVTCKETFVNIRRIKRRVSQKDFWIDQEMRLEEIEKSGNEQPCIANGLVLVRRPGLFPDGDLPVIFEESFVIESYMTHDTETVRDNACLVGVTEMPVYV